MGIAHLDLKPENVLLASDESDASEIRLVDFGSAAYISERTRRPSDGGGATPAYAAPEVLRGVAFAEKADVWSLGVILYLLLTGTHPFDAQNDADDAEVTRRILAGASETGAFAGPAWARVPAAARELLTLLLSTDPDARPSAAEMLAHPWICDPEAACGESCQIDAALAAEAVDALRQFHRGRRRFKALLLAVMLGYADTALLREAGKGTAQIGSRRAAMDIFDLDGDGIVTAADIQRVAQLCGEELSLREVAEMVHALDPRKGAKALQRKTWNDGPAAAPVPRGGNAASRPSPFEKAPRRRADDAEEPLDGTDLTVETHRLRHLLPPLYPSHTLARGDVVFSAGEVDARFYVLLTGDILVSHSFTLRPRPGYTTSMAPHREVSLGLHRLTRGESFGETELLESSVAGALPRASTAICASTACELLSVPACLFHLLSDVFDGVQRPLHAQAQERAKGLVTSWVSALTQHGADGGLARRANVDRGGQAWANGAYDKGMPLGKASDAHRQGKAKANSAPAAPSGAAFPTPLKRKALSKADAFIVVEDGVVEVTVADVKTGARQIHTLWPKDFCYCNERPGHHPLDSRGEFASTVVVDVRAVTSAQLTLVPGDVFLQAINQPAMQLVEYYITERFRDFYPAKTAFRAAETTVCKVL